MAQMHSSQTRGSAAQERKEGQMGLQGNEELWSIRDPREEAQPRLEGYLTRGLRSGWSPWAHSWLILESFQPTARAPCPSTPRIWPEPQQSSLQRLLAGGAPGAGAGGPRNGTAGTPPPRAARPDRSCTPRWKLHPHMEAAPQPQAETGAEASGRPGCMNGQSSTESVSRGPAHGDHQQRGPAACPASASVLPDVRIPEREERRLSGQCNSQTGKFISDSSQGFLPQPMQWCRVRKSLKQRLLAKFIRYA